MSELKAYYDMCNALYQQRSIAHMTSDSGMDNSDLEECVAFRARLIREVEKGCVIYDV